MTGRVCVGAVAGAFGVQGSVRLKSFCTEPDSIADYGPLETEDGVRHFDVTIERPVKNGFAARLSGIRDKAAAEALRGTRLYVPRDRLPVTDEDEFYHADLLGLTVVDTGGVILGQVKAVLNHGASDLLEISLSGGKGTALLPFSLAVVPTVDIASGRIVADPPDGALPDE